MKQRSKSEVVAVQHKLRGEIFAPLRRPLISIGIFSVIVNFLVLALPLYMMNIFDRVLTSLSIETLISLALMTTGLLIAMGLIDIQRSRALARIGLIIDSIVAQRMIGALLRANLNARIHHGMMDEIDKIRGFLGGQGVVALFDIPFAPIYLAILFLMSPWLGYTGLFFGVTVIAISLALEWRAQSQERDTEASLKRVAFFAENSVRNAEVVTALGMADRVRDRWQHQRTGLLNMQTRAQDMGAAGSGILKAANMVMQVVIAGVACYLVINEQLTSGALFAANIIAGRMVMPIQYIITAWKGYAAARDAFNSLSGLIATFEPEKSGVALPAPARQLEVVKASAIPPGSQQVVVKDVSFTSHAGEVIGIVGPSGSGKSTLARLILGLWPLRGGAIRLDGADVHSWPAEELGPHIGYVPQDVELLDGTVGENIARFGPLDSDAIIAAARAVGIHETILQLASGYDTVIKSHGGVLSGGQRQRLALARAIFGDPFLVVLDEPNSNMDEQGEADLIALISDLKLRGKIVILITHSRRLLTHVDKILMIKNGKSLRFASPAEFANKPAEVGASKQMKVV